MTKLCCQCGCGTLGESSGMCGHCQIKNQVEYEISAEDARILDRACTPLLRLVSGPTRNLIRQQNICNDKWAKIATKYGADPRTMRQSLKEGYRFFIAVPLGVIK